MRFNTIAEMRTTLANTTDGTLARVLRIAIDDCLDNIAQLMPMLGADGDDSTFVVAADIETSNQTFLTFFGYHQVAIVEDHSDTDLLKLPSGEYACDNAYIVNKDVFFAVLITTAEGGCVHYCSLDVAKTLFKNTLLVGATTKTLIRP